MSLLQPNAGLVFWMLLAFGIVFFILAKFAWPFIIGAAEKRSNFIADSVKSAEESNKQFANIKIEAENIINDAQNQRAMIMKETAESREKIISDAKLKAVDEAEKILVDARLTIQKERQEVESMYRNDVASAAVMIAEKLLRRELANDKEQMELIDTMLNELKK